MNDYLRLNGLRFFAYHGVKPEERRDGQWFEVDVELRGNLRIPGRTDRLEDAWDYQEIYQLTEQSVTGGQYNLIEALAEAVCQRLLERFPAESVRVSVRKPGAPLPGELRHAEVVLFRTPEDLNRADGN